MQQQQQQHQLQDCAQEGDDPLPVPPERQQQQQPILQQDSAVSAPPAPASEFPATPPPVEGFTPRTRTGRKKLRRGTAPPGLVVALDVDADSVEQPGRKRGMDMPPDTTPVPREARRRAPRPPDAPVLDVDASEDDSVDGVEQPPPAPVVDPDGCVADDRSRQPLPQQRDATASSGAAPE